ncbi:Fur family transcriptional regulator [Kitasatospora cineracea]|uniref:Fur family transcriptional regulator n=1 Tax=Kitasatospora cineracea TaxID=88074 RepID=UPI0033F7EB00
MTRPPEPAARAGRESPQQALVRRTLAACPGFTSAQLLHLRMASAGTGVSLSTVYRTLASLTGAGLVDVVRDDSGERLYRHRPGPGHRHYLICRRCGHSLAVDSAEVETWAARTAGRSGFADVHHRVELHGTCPACLTGRADEEPRPGGR